MRSQRPSTAEAAEYYFTYIDRVPDGDVVEHLEKQIVETRALLSSVDEELAGFRYQADKWSVKQVVGHVADAERVFVYRALAFSRGDRQAIPGMDQDLWMKASRFDELPFSAVSNDLVAIRASTVTLFRGLSEAQWQHRGTASEMEFQTGAIAWIIAGHELHHRGVLEERYGIGG
ncbi:MAG: DinB family protein [bacterium]|nr:DinB family protein [bacterium]